MLKWLPLVVVVVRIIESAYAAIAGGTKKEKAVALAENLLSRAAVPVTAADKAEIETLVDGAVEALNDAGVFIHDKRKSEKTGESAKKATSTIETDALAWADNKRGEKKTATEKPTVKKRIRSK